MSAFPAAMLNSLQTHLPAGRQMIEIVESAYEPNSTRTGMLLKCTAQIVGGDYDGRPYYLNLCLEHEDAETQQIGQRDFAALRRATGVHSPQSTWELHLKPFDVVIGVRTSKDTREPENVIREYVFGRAV
ncbi:DUF669 domain-containing protein [Bosea sp. 2KB_26]|uniref:DUF669 domain-containing protein n=1 Tax=Bosea sp. 2KB_26 TaxID=3237475 RepID=UPI003F937EAA